MHRVADVDLDVHWRLQAPRFGSNSQRCQTSMRRKHPTNKKENEVRGSTSPDRWSWMFPHLLLPSSASTGHVINCSFEAEEAVLT